MVKIITMCRQGLCRSVGLADVLKMHFEPVDVIPIGHFGNTPETIKMLSDWADKIIVMQPDYLKHIDEDNKHKTLVCDVGADTYYQPKNRELIDKVWYWCRQNANVLGITEHNKKL